jgi:uncharacterized membrane protein YidH (DUF202 family)
MMISDNDLSQSKEGAVPDGTVIGEVQLILAEKRTSLAMLRTGIAVLVLPMSVMSFLVATSTHYEIGDVWQLLVPLLALCLAMVVLAAYLIVRSVLKLRNEDRLVNDIKRKHSRIAEFID